MINYTLNTCCRDTLYFISKPVLELVPIIVATEIGWQGEHCQFGYFIDLDKPCTNSLLVDAVIACSALVSVRF